MANELVTLQEVKTHLGLTGTEEDAKLTQLIAAATLAIQSYTGRNFADDPASSPRTYLYDGSGFLEIDDATAVTVVAMDGATLDPSQYNVQPYNAAVKTWLDLAPFQNQSWEMGFTRNLDQPWGRQRLVQRSVQVTVTADWGWAETPADVKLAAFWTISAWRSNPDDVVSESIANYSRSYAQFGGVDSVDAGAAIPARARKLLDLYIRISL